MAVYEDIEYASLTDVGVRRSHNQDNRAILLAADEHQWLTRGHVFVVADGMGAHAVGELASELAVGIIPHTYDKHAAQGTAAALRKAFVEANTSIHAKGQQNREFEGMGTTATALILRPDGAWLGHVGDSRVYRVRDGQIEQLTFDHSMVWEYARRQKMDPEEVQGIPSNVIFRSLGPEPLVPVDIEGIHPIHPGDTFVLCSDGLSGQVGDPEIGAVAATLPPAEACRFLVDLANLRGGPDNITVMIVRAGAGLATPAPPKVPWRERVPWPLPTLGLGVVCAGGAVYLGLLGWMTVAVLYFLVALVVIVAGIVGLVAVHRREKQRESEEEERPRPKVHRRQSCRLDRAFVETVAQAVLSLQQQAREKNWEADWDTFEALREVAEVHVSRGDMLPAFRDYTKAMQTLLAAMNPQRARGEAFHPVWDKGGNGRDSSYKCGHCGKVTPTPARQPVPTSCPACGFAPA